MNYFKVLGIDRNLSSYIFIAIITLILLGLATNAVYDLTHVLDGSDFNSYSFLVNVGYIFVFIFWLWMLQIASTPKRLCMLPSVKPAELEKAYQGIVLILSKPYKLKPNEINETMSQELSANPDNPTNLYAIRSIGQLFKGLYKHKRNLRYVWPIVSEDSMPFRDCIDRFLENYIPGAKRAGHNENGNGLSGCLLPQCNEGTEMIKNVKNIVSKIYAEENLAELGLKKQDVILDMSGGTKTMTIGAVFGAIDEEIDIQYVEQTSNQLISVSITPDNVLDKILEYLLERSKKPMS